MAEWASKAQGGRVVVVAPMACRSDWRKPGQSIAEPSGTITSAGRSRTSSSRAWSAGATVASNSPLDSSTQATPTLPGASFLTSPPPVGSNTAAR